AFADRRQAAAAVDVNGASVSAEPDAMGYVSIDREWKDGDVVQIALPLEPRRVVADERVADDRRRAAIERGPIVYCAEWPEAGDARVLDLQLDRAAALTTSADETLDGGVVVVKASARSVTRPDAERSLTLVPYSLWANRGAGEMAVWLPT